jgi:hypothetical protein
VKPADQHLNSTRHAAKAPEHFHAVSASAVKVSSVAIVNVPTRISENQSLMLSHADPTTKLMLNAMDVETAYVVSVIATHAKTQKNLSVDSTASAITSRVIVTTAFSARVPTTEFVSAETANVMMDGVDRLASAAAPRKLAKRPTVKFARDTENASVESASATLKMTSDTQESIARSAQHALAVVMNSKTALSVKCTTREN